MIKESILAAFIGMILMFMTANAAAETKYEKATIASRSLWCMEPPFAKLDAAIDVIVGYTCGNKRNLTYKQVASSSTGHAGSFSDFFDPSKLRYEQKSSMSLAAD